MNIGQAAEFLGVCRATLNNLHKTGKLIPETIYKTKTKCYSVSKLEDFLRRDKFTTTLAADYLGATLALLNDLELSGELVPNIQDKIGLRLYNLKDLDRIIKKYKMKEFFGEDKMTVVQTAEFLEVTKKALILWKKKGMLEPIIDPNTKLRYYEFTDVRDFIKNNKEELERERLIKVAANKATEIYKERVNLKIKKELRRIEKKELKKLRLKKLG